MKSSLHSLITFFPLFSITFDCRLSQFSAATANSGTRLNSHSRVRDLLYDKPLETNSHQFFFQLIPWCHNPYVTFSLTRGWICRLKLLLTLARAVILKPESRGTHYYILLSQIRDSPNLEGQVPVFISPRIRVAQLYPQRLGSLKVKVKVTLWLTVSQSVSLGVEPYLGLMTRYLLLFDSYGLLYSAPLWREDGSVFCICCWFSPAQSFSSPCSDSWPYFTLSDLRLPFRRLLRLAGSRSRYSTPPPHWCRRFLIIWPRCGPT
jgi:hypothetical protein